MLAIENNNYYPTPAYEIITDADLRHQKTATVSTPARLRRAIRNTVAHPRRPGGSVPNAV
ncbi:MAG: hypothetical protein HQL50_15665, partial [Magnetococcales bacterium]|nr:hypothetical protein [Magnetococcales bacterium]